MPIECNFAVVLDHNFRSRHMVRKNERERQGTIERLYINPTVRRVPACTGGGHRAEQVIKDLV